MSAASPAEAARRTVTGRETPAFTAFDALLYGVTVFAWSTSWIALKMQVGVVAPEVSVAWRFMLAAAVMFGWLAATGRQIAFPPRDHLRFAAQGALIFSTNFYLFYVGGQYLASGLLSVVFSLASVFNLVLAALVFRQKIEPRVAVGALIGFAGIGMIYEPEIVGVEFSHDALVGLLLCIGGTLFFCSGNMMSTSNQRKGLPLAATTAWGMAYGSAIMVALALVNGREFTVEWTWPYLGGLAWLSVVSSVLAFAAYLTLLGRIGAARAGYATVIFPVFALGISTVFENYQWTPIAVAGLVAVMAGNLIVLTRGKR